MSPTALLLRHIRLFAFKKPIRTRSKQELLLKRAQKGPNTRISPLDYETGADFEGPIFEAEPIIFPAKNFLKSMIKGEKQNKRR